MNIQKSSTAPASRTDVQRYAYDDEMRQYVLLRNGDPAAVAEGTAMFQAAPTDILSADTLRNLRYMFVASTTLASRFAIEGGMNAEDAYATSDFFIKKMDAARTKADIYATHRAMFETFTNAVVQKKKQAVASRPLVEALQIISQNLHRKITLTEVATRVGVSAPYLSALFREHTGATFSQTVTARKTERAQELLEHSSLSFTEIAQQLGFTSQNYFIRAFRQRTGETPKTYRTRTQGREFRA